MVYKHKCSSSFRCANSYFLAALEHDNYLELSVITHFDFRSHSKAACVFIYFVWQCRDYKTVILSAAQKLGNDCWSTWHLWSFSSLTTETKACKWELYCEFGYIKTQWQWFIPLFSPSVSNYKHKKLVSLCMCEDKVWKKWNASLKMNFESTANKYRNLCIFTSEFHTSESCSDKIRHGA